MGRLTHTNQTSASRIRRVRNVVRGSSERPRLSVAISNRCIAAQVIDDSKQRTLVGLKSKTGTINVQTATEFGSDFAKAVKKAKVSKVVLDRGNKKYHGCLQAFADAARKEGMEF